MATRTFTRTSYALASSRRVARPWRGFARRSAVWVFVGIGLLFLSGAGLVLWWSKDLPDPQDIDARRVAQSTKIFDRTGTRLLYEIGEVHRTTIALNDIAPFLRQATLAAEDDQFYEHHGLALTGIIRGVILKPLSGSRAQGGSTITQQLIKNSILTPERTLQRKVKEAVLALELEQRFSKDQILEMYLNDIPYGSQAYGTQAAAQAFFGVSAKEVSLSQAAALAALPKAPSYYSPYGSHFEDLKGRQEYILDRMATLAMISREQAAAAKKEPLRFQPRREAIAAPHFVFYVREQLDKEYGERVVEQGGLKVTTTLDASLQEIAEEVMKERRDSLRKISDKTNAALAAIDPKTGDILAMVGSADYFDETIDGNVNVAIRHRSPGSSIKPFIYAAAWQKGYTPDTILVDAETDFGQGYAPKNFDLGERGPVTMRGALSMSLNIPAVQTLYLVGINQATELARKMGMESLTDPDRYGLSLVLGGGEVRLVDEVSAYGVFAAEGVRHPHRAILKVENAQEMLFDATEDKEAAKGTKVIEPQLARQVSAVLSDNAARAPVFGASSPLQLGARPVAAKTGTTQEFRDGWTLGYTPSLAAGVWVGNNDNTPLKSKEPGVQTAAPLWNAFMRRALATGPIEKFTPPEPLKNIPDGVLKGQLPEVKAKWDPATKLAYSLDCPVEIGQPRTFKALHSVLYYVQRSNPLGPPPADPQQDPQFNRWEAAVAAWREKHNEKEKDNPAEPLYMADLPAPICDSQNSEDLPKVTIVEPNTTILRQNEVTVKASVESQRPIKEVRFLVDSQEIAKRADGQPLEANFSVPAGFSGRKTVLILAVTDNNLVGRAHRTFIMNPDDSPPAITLHTPKNGITISTSAFPQQVKASASDKNGIESVDFLYRKEGSSSTQRIGRATTNAPVAPNRYEVSWANAPGTGTFEVWAIAYDKTGNFKESDHAIVMIE